MNHSRTIIKRRYVGPLVTEMEAESLAPGRALRIPGWQVPAPCEAHPAGASGASAPEGRVLRGAQARAAAAPYVMADLDIEPDFPLPEPGVYETPASLSDPAPDAGPDPARYGKLEAAWQARLEEAVERTRAEAYEEGYEQGYVAAEAALQASFDQRKAMVEDDVARLQAAWKEAMKKSEPLLASLAFEVAKQLLDAPLPQDVRAVSGQALAQAIEQFGEEAIIEVSLHPDDLSRLQAYGLTDDLEAMHSGVRWDPNPDVQMGDWIVQTPDAAIRRLKDELLNQLKSRLGLLAVMKKRDS